MAQSKSSMVGDMLSAEFLKHEDGIGSTVRDYFPNLSGDAFQNLSKSDYAKVIFCDLYYNTDSTVGCRFQITDNVHEDPCDYIGLYKVGYDSLSQCLASKMLSQTECEDDGKLLRCTFKPTELPDLEHGFYQFLYVTRDQEVCGASMPFEIKNTIPKDFSSDEDIVADRTEDDFLVVRSNAAEKNRRLQLLLDEMNEKCLAHESEMRKFQTKFRILNEEKLKLETLLRKATEEKRNLVEESCKLSEERDTISKEKEEAVRILKEKNSVLSTIFDDFSCKLKGFTELKDTLEADKNLAIAESVNLQERLKKLTEELQNKQKILEEEKERNQEMTNNLRKENSVLNSQLDDARLMIEALEKSKQLSMTDLSCLSQTISELKGKFKDMKCENYALKAKLHDTTSSLKQRDDQMEDMKSEIAALKLHIIEIEESKPSKASSPACDSVKDSPRCQAVGIRIPIIVEGEYMPSVQEESVQTSIDNSEELQNLKIQLDEIRTEVEEKNTTILRLKEELVKSNAVVDYLTKERDSVQKSGAQTQDALNECVLRLNEASELYKKQYRKIEKLKKKLKKNKTSLSEDHSSEVSSVRDLSAASDTGDDVPEKGAVNLPFNQNSDSDTGEHVLGHPLTMQKQQSVTILGGGSLISSFSHPPSTRDLPSYLIKVREAPELQTMIEQNLEKLSSSKSKDDEEILYAIPCPVCDQDVGVYMSSTDEMVKHLEIQHRQQLCPVCGRLFDMTLPSKYFQFHVEDHFKRGHK